MLPGYTLLPIADAPGDETVCLVKGGADYAAAYRKNGRWLLGRPEQGTLIELDFEPTHWLRPPGADADQEETR
jgi:hypothetical protein